jgi:hypothetical protein
MNQSDIKNMSKISQGQQARTKWAKDISIENSISIKDFNNLVENKFTKQAEISLDLTEKRQSTLMVNPLDIKEWNSKQEHIYIIVRNDIIMKIGGTRDGMSGRWGSYLCGYYVQERTNKNGKPYPGKMSVTNAYLYHTIENDIIENKSTWEFYTWILPKTTVTIDIFGEKKEIITQTFHAYESICIKKFKQSTGTIPLLCDNSDPEYK